MTVGTAPASVPAGAPTCSDRSAAVDEALAGSASHARRWLVVEWRGGWGRDAVADTGLPDGILQILASFDGRVLLARRPDRRAEEAVVFGAEASEDALSLRRATAAGGSTRAMQDAIAAVGGGAGGEPVDEPLILVCTHGRRDACCARLGRPVFDALAPHVGEGLLWQSSHQGGHRFAANVLALPAGVQLGRVPAADAARVATLLRRGLIPLDLYRGRTLYEPWVQAAEVEIRRRDGLERVDDVRLLEVEGDRARFAVPGGEREARVASGTGPAVPASCGDEAAPTVRYVVSL